MLYCPNFVWNVLQVWMTGKDVYLQMTWSWPDKTWNILCSYCLQWNTSQSKFRNHYLLFLFAFSILSQLFLIWGCMFIYCICTQYLVGAPFALITASIWRGMEVISLWHCWGGMEAQVSLTAAFSSSALLGLVSLIFLLTIPDRFSMGFRSGEFAGQSSTVTPWSLNQLLVPLAVWAGAKSCWKMNQHLHKACQQKEAWKCSKISW